MIQKETFWKRLGRLENFIYPIPVLAGVFLRTYFIDCGPLFA